MLPAHKTYVEPFAGSAAVLFAKEPSDGRGHQRRRPRDRRRLPAASRSSRPEGSRRLKKLPWVGDEKTFKRLLDVEPGGRRRAAAPLPVPDALLLREDARQELQPDGGRRRGDDHQAHREFAPRLKKVKVYGGDYEKVVRKYDSKDTVFFLDPPYPGYNVDVGESEFDEERFFKLLKSLKGRFLITYGIRGKFPELVKA